MYQNALFSGLHSEPESGISKVTTFVNLSMNAFKHYRALSHLQLRLKPLHVLCFYNTVTCVRKQHCQFGRAAPLKY